MKISILLITALFFTAAFAQTEDDEIVAIVEVEEVEDEPKYKIVTEYYRTYDYREKKKLKSVGAYNEDYKPEGYWKHYTASDGGYLTSTGNYKNGKRIGHWKYYSQYGKVKAEGELTGELDPEYAYDKWIKKGTWIIYNEYTGRKSSEIYFNDKGEETGRKRFN